MKKNARMGFTERILAAGAIALFAMCASGDVETVDGIEWKYTVSDGKASHGGVGYPNPSVTRATAGSITIPSSLGGYPVTAIGDAAFWHCGGLTDVTIPDSVTNIAAWAMMDGDGAGRR